MKRVLFNVIAGLSAFMCLVAFFLWAWSFLYVDSYIHARHDTVFVINSQLGRIHFNLLQQRSTAQQIQQAFGGFRQNKEFEPPGTPHDYRWHILQLGFDRVVYTFPPVYNPPIPDQVTWLVQIPHWFFCLVFAVVPVVRYLAWKRDRSILIGACHACGYDLRATPDRCPECGSVAAEA